MPKPGFFSRLGLFVDSDFIEPAMRERLLGEARAASRIKAHVDRYGEKLLDEEHRLTSVCEVPVETRKMIYRRLLELKPALERHFKIELSGSEKPQFLAYREGDYFGPHRDGKCEPGSSEESAASRKVSVVIFLNDQAEVPEEGKYGGGSLTFYGLVDNPAWERYGFKLAGESGTLVAFRSDTAHEVTPVTHGERFTVVNWFF
jgi:predicted 2-oxoglutarate/Fe(II)-dependent dioxygenase YbiX